MKREITRAPPPSKLRPVKSPFDSVTDASFPVYKNLADTLARGDDDDTIRHVCAVLAGWAYSEVDTVSAIMARMGLENNACRSIAVENSAMLISSSSFLVQSSCGRVVLLAYRGTDPFNLATWAADADVNPVLVPAQEHATLRGRIHGGFYRNQRATWFDVIEGLTGAAKPGGGSIFEGLRQADPPLTGGHAHLDNPTQGKLEAIYITGHSLGAAMATIAAYKLTTEKEYQGILEAGRLKGVHCFAPPMVGNEDFARQWDEDPRLLGKLSTYIFENDLVPHLPPVPGFVHFGRTFVSSKPDRNADPSRFQWKESPSKVERAPVTALGDAALRLIGELTTVNVLGNLGTAVREFLVALGLKGRQYSLYDHAPTNYVACSQPDGIVRTEFGNDF